ncbi:uncharacterized protein [Narcine bancroftii]|uniref:uncharacterized protein isoform X2 n=1 Tax=Narcine bancroftii TaxID=1343680 RepID=UPI0038319E93
MQVSGMRGRRSSSRGPRTSAVDRFRRLPLVNSTTQLVAAAYSDIKQINWLVRSASGLVEGSARLAVRLASKATHPLLKSFQSQVTATDDLADRRLDQLEEKFPILQLSIDEVTSHLSESLSLTLDDMQEWLSAERINLLGRPRAAVVMTRGFLSAQVASLLNTNVGQGLVTQAGRFLVRLERTVDHYLPDPQEGPGDTVSGFDREENERRGLGDQAWRLVLKAGLRGYSRALVSSQNLQEMVLTNGLLLIQVLDRISSSQMFSLMWRAHQRAHWVDVGRVYTLSRLQAQLWAHLAATITTRSDLGISYLGRTFSQVSELLRQCIEVVFLMLLIIFNYIWNLEPAWENDEEWEEGSEDELHTMNLWTDPQVSPRCGDDPLCGRGSAGGPAKMLPGARTPTTSSGGQEGDASRTVPGHPDPGQPGGASYIPGQWSQCPQTSTRVEGRRGCFGAVEKFPSHGSNF